MLERVQAGSDVEDGGVIDLEVTVPIGMETEKEAVADVEGEEKAEETPALEVVKLRVAGNIEKLRSMMTELTRVEADVRKEFWKKMRSVANVVTEGIEREVERRANEEARRQAEWEVERKAKKDVERRLKEVLRELQAADDHVVR